MLVAVVSAKPTIFLTLHSKDKCRHAMTRDFRCLVKRLNRDRRSCPLIYVATVARADGGTGYHVHALVWRYIHAGSLGGHCTDLGLGSPDLHPLACEHPGDLDSWMQVSYVLTQHDTAFGYTQHDRHEPVPKYGRKLLYPQARTLATHCPDLLSAMKTATDPAVSDETLCSLLPRFSSTDNGGMRRSARKASPSVPGTRSLLPRKGVSQARAVGRD